MHSDLSVGNTCGQHYAVYFSSFGLNVKVSKPILFAQSDLNFYIMKTANIPVYVNIAVYTQVIRTITGLQDIHWAERSVAEPNVRSEYPSSCHLTDYFITLNK